MRSSVTSSMQKTYDECYLICSTAVYYESQNNEAEALRSWRSALDHIYYHFAYRMPPSYRPKTETDKALMDSLREMEKQCKERVDLLEALRRSRLDSGREVDPSTGGSSTSSQQDDKRHHRGPSSTDQDRASLGQGTVPAVTQAELARPKPPPLPQRPTVIVSRRSETDIPKRQANPEPAPATMNPSPALPVPSPTKISRTPSPEKRTGFLTTLRNNKDGNRSSRSPRATTAKKESRPAAAKAATQAWGSLSRTMGNQLGQRMAEGGSTTSLNSLRRDAEGLHVGEHIAGSNDAGESSQDTKKTGPSRPSLSSRDSDRRRLPGDTQPMERRRSEDDGQRSRNPTVSAKPSNSSYAWPVYTSRGEEARQPISKPKACMPLPPPPSARPRTSPEKTERATVSSNGISRRPVANSSSPRTNQTELKNRRPRGHSSSGDDLASSSNVQGMSRRDHDRGRERERPRHGQAASDGQTSTSPDHSTSSPRHQSPETRAREERITHLTKNLPRGVDEGAAQQIFNEIVVQGDEVHWDDIAGLEVAKNALKEAVVYPFLRPDLFMGLREPARGMLLFGPPGTGKTMLARAVATESRSTFFSISASSLTSKYLGESEKLVRALFGLAKALAPSIIFVDEIDSLLSSRGGGGGGVGGGGGGGEHEATRRIKTEFLIQWSDLARAAAGRELTDKEKEKERGGDPSRVLVLAATNLPWAIDEAARRRFVRRQYIPLPEGPVRARQLATLLSHQKHHLGESDIARLVELTDGFSGSDITALAKDAAMGPLRELGEALLHMSPDDIRPIELADFEASLTTIRPSVSKKGLQQYEEWAREFGERGG